jgi:hypothetical protein
MKLLNMQGKCIIIKIRKRLIEITSLVLLIILNKEISQYLRNNIKVLIDGLMILILSINLRKVKYDWIYIYIRI